MSSRIAMRRSTALMLAIVGVVLAGSTARAQTVLTACGNITSAGNYALGRNITAAGDCFILKATNVAIDFKGKTLTGNGTGRAILDDGTARNYAVISNGRIRNFENGIYLADSGLATIYKMDVSGNSGGGIFINERSSTLEAVKANDNGGDGIFINGGNSTLTNTETRGNGDDGMDLRGGGYAVNRCSSSDNGENGIFGEDGATSVNDCELTNNGNDGVFLADDQNIVNNSTVSGNSDDGIELESSYNLVSRCKVKKNGDVGIDMSDDSINQVTASSSTSNYVGVRIFCPGTLVDVKASGNLGGDLIELVGTCTKLNAP